MKKLVIYLLFSLIIIGNVNAENTNLINFQGYLVDTQDKPLTGEYEITFKIYSSSTNGDILWSETDLINIDNGFYSIILGQNNSVNIPFDGDVWFALQIENQSEMEPRYRYTPALYSNVAGTAKSLDGFEVSSTPEPGKIILLGPDGKLPAGVLPGSQSTNLKAYSKSENSWKLTENQTITTEMFGEIITFVNPGKEDFNNEQKVNYGEKSPFGDILADEWEISGEVIQTATNRGIARGHAGNRLYGNRAETIINFGASCTTGVLGQNRMFSTLTGGVGNKAEHSYTFVGGGALNKAIGFGSTVVAGGLNRAVDSAAFVGGGKENKALNKFSTACGGNDNEASGDYASVCGGDHNTASGSYNHVGGGYLNTASNYRSVVSGGDRCSATGFTSAVTGGQNSDASGSFSFIGGGTGNVASEYCAVSSGGWCNVASGETATTPGGMYNAARGDYSFAAGTNAKAHHNGSIVVSANLWLLADSIRSGGDEQMVMRADGGIYITNSGGSAPYTTTRLINTSTGAYLSSGGTWVNASDRNLKENIALIDGKELLEKLAKLPISKWNYISGDEDVKHIGPMAQDFYEIYGLGENNTTISTIDPAGVSLAAAQELYKITQEQKAEIDELKTKLNDLENFVITTLAKIEDKPEPEKGTKVSMVEYEEKSK